MHPVTLSWTASSHGPSLVAGQLHRSKTHPGSANVLVDHPHHKLQSGCSIQKPFSWCAEDWMPNIYLFATRLKQKKPYFFWYMF